MRAWPVPGDVTDADPVALSAEFLLAVRRGEPTVGLAADLADLADRELAAALDTDPARLAFWTNVYNAATQRALAADPSRYDNRRQFFTADLVAVAGRPLSLDDIEHAILRRSYHKLALGYLRVPGPLRSAFADRHAPDERDPPGPLRAELRGRELSRHPGLRARADRPATGPGDPELSRGDRGL